MASATSSLSYDNVSVTLNNQSLSLKKGETSTLTASVAPSGLISSTVTWTSNNTSVATVSGNGVVTAVNAGTAVITATASAASGKQASCTVTVKETTFTVSFNANGGSVSPASTTVTYGSTYGTLPTPTRTGHTFNGWYTEPSGGTQITANTTVSLTANQTLYAQWTVNSYRLDLNGYLDGVADGGLYEYGTADVYINGTLVADDVSDYCTSWPHGTTYEIKDIKPSAGYQYNGVYSGSLAGTINAADAVVYLNFTKKYYWLDLNGYLDGELKDGLYEYGTADVYINGELVADDVSDYSAEWPYGTTYEISDIKPKEFWRYNGVYSGLLAGTIGIDNAADIRLNFSKITSGYSGGNTAWSYQDGVLTISGSGKMYDYVTPDWLLFCSSITSVVVEDGVTYIGESAFILCSELTSVSLPDTLTEIGGVAFNRCTALTTIVLPTSLRKIGKYTFSNDTALTSIIIPSNVTSIGESAFENCSNLTIECWAHTTAHSYAKANGIPYKLLDTSFGAANVTFPATTRQIKAHALRSTKARRVMVPEGVTAIGSGAFENCAQLEAIYIPYSCGSIAADAFSGVTDLVIYGRAGSYAETYAQQYGFDFDALSGQ